MSKVTQRFDRSHEGMFFKDNQTLYRKETKNIVSHNALRMYIFIKYLEYIFKYKNYQKMKIFLI